MPWPVNAALVNSWKKKIMAHEVQKIFRRTNLVRSTSRSKISAIQHAPIASCVYVMTHHLPATLVPNARPRRSGWMRMGSR